ncbi:MAG: hypothetical protein WBG38_18085 [Nodosilinea sp.]
MQDQFNSLVQAVLQKGFPIALSFIDDALLLLATRAGLHWPWLKWLSTVLLTATLLYWGMQILLFLWTKLTAFEPDSEPEA